MNRVKEYNLSAKKAYEFAKGVLYPKNGKIVYVFYSRSKNQQNRYPNLKKVVPTELTEEEQEIFLNNPLYAFRYAKKFKKRLCKKVEQNFLQQITEDNVPNVIYYCKLFNLAVPECFHNFAMITAGISGNDRKQLIRSRKNKRYLEQFNKNKTICKQIIDYYLNNNQLNLENSIKELIDILN